MTKVYAFCLTIFFAGCSGGDSTKLIGKNSGNISRVRTYGDSVRVEIEDLGNTIIQHVIDLKGTEDDGFDNSYTLTTKWSDRNTTPLGCPNQLMTIYDSIAFRFCTAEAIRYYEKAVHQDFSLNIGSGLDPSGNPIKPEKHPLLVDLDSIKDMKVAQLELYPYTLMVAIDFEAIDLRSKDTLRRVVIGDYNTEFSGGKHYYFVNSEEDTIREEHINEYIQ